MASLSRFAKLLCLMAALAMVLPLAGCRKKTQTEYPILGESKKISAYENGRHRERIYSDDVRPYAPPANQALSTKATSTSATLTLDTEYTELEEFKLGPGDMLEIIYQLTAAARDEAYVLDVMDQIEVQFFYTPKFDRKRTVRTDGKIEMPLVGDLSVVGKTTKEVEALLEETYRPLLKDPKTEVRVVFSHNAIEELKRAITTSPRGQSRLEPIRPDGRLSLPLIGDIGAAGRTVEQLRHAIVARYRAVGVQDIDITVVLLEVKSNVVYVMGEVAKPGPINLEGPAGIWRLIATAGGMTDSADRFHVFVDREGGETNFRRVLNMDAWSKGDLSQNLNIRRGDLIYVPKDLARYIYVTGEVKTPGAVRLDQGSNLTVSQAIASAGGIKASAGEQEILVLRRGDGNEPIVIKADMRKLFDVAYYTGKNTKAPRDPYLQPGDVVFIPRSPIGDLNRFAETYFKDGLWTIFPFNTVATYNIND